ncbi:hypothetical protein RB195_014797 [Necator americanus]|uniref:Uncharacterized protein n=1 Tax=Necator americanus TaxID=51031 RepID=A0ABR1E1M9_NECAM
MRKKERKRKLANVNSSPFKAINFRESCIKKDAQPLMPGTILSTAAKFRNVKLIDWNSVVQWILALPSGDVAWQKWNMT